MEQKSISAIQVFRENTGELKNRGDQLNAIDGDLSTWSYMTPSGTEANIWFISGFQLKETSYVNQVRLAKHRPSRDYDHFNKVIIILILLNSFIIFLPDWWFCEYNLSLFFRYYIQLTVGTLKVELTDQFLTYKADVS